MADNKLMIRISTALDKAGIQATQEQMKSLEGQLTRMNQQSANLGPNFGKAKGAIGSILGGLGKVAGIVSLIIAAFEAGWAIGKKISGVLAEHWSWYGKIVNSEKERNRANKKAFEEQQKAMEQMRKTADADLDAVERCVEAEKRRTAEIMRAKEQRISELKIMNEGTKLVNKGAIADIDRLNFEDKMNAINQGASDEAIEQLDAAYDVIRKTVMAEQQLEELENSRLEKTEEMEKQETAIKNAKEAQAKLRMTQIDEYRALRDAKNYGKGEVVDENGKKKFMQAQTAAEHDEVVRQRQKVYDAAKKAQEAAADKVRDEQRKLELMITKRNVLFDQQKALLKEELYRTRDEAGFRYDRSLTSNGDLIGMNFTDDFIAKFNQSSVDSYNELKEISQNTANLVDEMRQAFELKK